MSRSSLVFKTSLFSALTAASGLVLAQALPYRSGVEFFYEVEAGDTPASIKEDLLRSDITWSHVVQLNKLADPTDISRVKQLRMPVTWLREGAKYARVEMKSGDVRVNGKAAEKGSVVTESETIETGKSGVVVITLPDGTEMTIAPSSRVRIDRLRQYFDGESIDARLKLERGEIKSYTPHAKDGKFDKRKRDIRIRTPKATAAVRGTQFRVALTDGISASGVLAGLVNWTDNAPDGSADVSLDKGFGAAFSKAGRPSGKEALLPAPVVRVPEDVQNQTDITIPFEPVTGAARYEIKVASNTAFTDVIEQYTTTDTAVTFKSQRDGNHFVAVRALSPSGVEGYDGIGKFSFLARPFAPGLQEPGNNDKRPLSTTALRWQPVDGATHYRVQLASDAGFTNIVQDRKVSATEFGFQPASTINQPVRRFWRVASMQDWTVGPFTPVRSFELLTTGPKPTGRADAQNTVTVSWPTQPDAVDYLLDIQRVGESRKRSPIAVEQSRLELTGYQPGQYDVSVIARYPDNLVSLASETTRITVSAPPPRPTNKGIGGEEDVDSNG